MALKATLRKSRSWRRTNDVLTPVRIPYHWVRGELTCGSLNLGSRGGTTSNSSLEGLQDPFHAGSQEGRRDFDDGCNAFWSLFAKKAKTHDEARFQRVKEDMDGVILFAGLIAAFLTPFLSQSIQGLQSDPAQESVYYQQQSLAILVQISQQIASIAPQVPIPLHPPPPYPPFKPSFSDIRVNIYLVSGLVCSLAAALLAILIQQWVRSYMQIFQRYDQPLKRARFRQFFFEGAKGMQSFAEAVPRLIQLSLFLFFLGLGDSLIYANTIVGVTSVALICVFGFFY
ncbi:hypothetical protein EI94DRAFT_1574064, partial [Lactarius quietus]